VCVVLVCGRTVLGGEVDVSVCVVLACGRTVLGGKAGASVCGGWRVVERSWVVRPVPVCVVVGVW